MSGTTVQFWALINKKLDRVSGRLTETLVDIFKKPGIAVHLPEKITHHSCKFYRLKRPVEMGDDNTDDEDDGDNENGVPDSVMQECLDETNWVEVRPMRTKVARLAKQISEDYIYLIIDFPDPLLRSERAIGELQQRYSALFKCLQVRVEKQGSWCKEDTNQNLLGGTLETAIVALPPVLQVVDSALGQKRGYIQTNDETHSRDFQNACRYKTQFDLIFTPATTHSPAVVKERELAAFYQVLRCFYEDVEIIAGDTSSALKAGNFTIYFVQPPFFSKTDDDSRSFEYQQEKSWKFPIFVDTSEAPKSFRKFTPRSDWMVTSRTHHIPFMISEVISDGGERDRERMLVQATALARAGRFLLKSSDGVFFVVAIYLDARMVASRYIVMQHAPDAEGISSEKVSIHQKDFDLKIVDEEVKFLCEMYNLATRIDKMSKGLDEKKHLKLLELKKDAKSVLSLNSTKHTTTKAPDNENLDPIAEGGTHGDEPEDEDDLGVFEAADIQRVLHRMNYKIEFIPWGHPQLAVIVNEFDNKHGYLKFTDRENEVNALRYLAGLSSPLNHTISDVQFWPVQGGTVISMPVAGGWLTALENPNEQLWSAALQFFEAVAFMHEHNVAHMDIKPKNVIIPLKGGRLSIIDFSVSIIVDGPDVKYKGVVGTEGYIGPEVRKGYYKPILADLWSCGRTVEELCACCDPSPSRTKLLEVARLLMARNPEARPRMSQVLEYLSSEEQVAPPILAVASRASKSSPCLA